MMRWVSFQTLFCTLLPLTSSTDIKGAVCSHTSADIWEKMAGLGLSVFCPFCMLCGKRYYFVIFSFFLLYTHSGSFFSCSTPCCLWLTWPFPIILLSSIGLKMWMLFMWLQEFTPCKGNLLRGICDCQKMLVTWLPLALTLRAIVRYVIHGKVKVFVYNPAPQQLRFIAPALLLLLQPLQYFQCWSSEGAVTVPRLRDRLLDLSTTLGRRSQAPQTQKYRLIYKGGQRSSVGPLER